MKRLELPTFLLVLVLQCAPICRVVCLKLGAPPAGSAIVFRCAVGAVALLGSYHAVSGCSAAISGAASGCPNPRYQFEMLAPGSQTWQVVKPYSSSNAFVWNTSGAARGTYKFIVKVRDASSVGVFSNYASSWDAYVALPYSLT